MTGAINDQMKLRSVLSQQLHSIASNIPAPPQVLLTTRLKYD